MVSMSATRLRKDIYQIIDRVARTGEPVTVTRKGQKVLLVPQTPVPRMQRLKRRNVMLCTPESIVHMDWSDQWKASI